MGNLKTGAFPMKLFACNPTLGARSLQAFGWYLCGTGALLLLAPALVLAPLNLPVPQDVWIRILGVVALALGYTDVVASKVGNVHLFWASVWRRAAAGVALLTLVMTGIAPMPVVLFALVDMGAAAWTALALRHQPRPKLQTA
jgi:hypothetical protein